MYLVVMLRALLTLLGQTENYFPAKAGMEWYYEGTGPGGTKDPVKKIVDVEMVRSTDCFVLEDGGFRGILGKWYFDATSAGVKAFRFLPESENSIDWLKFPLKKGETWEAEMKIPAQEPLRINASVEAEEEIQVPAGTFKAFRVSWAAVQGKAATEVTSWFAAGQGEVARKVKAGGESYEFKLKKIEQKKVILAWRRLAAACACKKGCQCMHCSKSEPDARCYCKTGGCACGAQMPECNCRHCSGMTGGDDGKGRCGCGK